MANTLDFLFSGCVWKDDETTKIQIINQSIPTCYWHNKPKAGATKTQCQKISPPWLKSVSKYTINRLKHEGDSLHEQTTH